MAHLFMLLVTCCSLFCSAFAAGDSFMIPSHRKEAQPGTVDAISAIRKRQSGANSSHLGKSLYWFGEFSVGDTPSVDLVIDTASNNLLMLPGIYKPSVHSKPYGSGNFSITYVGVDRLGFGFETLNGSTVSDIVSAAGLTVPDQPVGNVKTHKFFDVRPGFIPWTTTGIIGFAGAGSSVFKPQSRSWFTSLCHNKAISECRFGLVFGTSGKGLTVVGKLAKKFIKGDLTVVKAKQEILVKSDVTVDNKIIFKDQNIVMDVGTDDIEGPLVETREIFKMLGYQTVERSGHNFFHPAKPLENLIGFFPCDKPPTLGFSFPAQSQLRKGQKSKNFNVSPLVWAVYNHGDNNCTSVLGGTNALTQRKKGKTFWLLGQPFFAGKYVDFDYAAKTVSFGDLQDPSMESST